MAVDDSYTKILLHLDGADGSTTITDESGKTWTARDNAQIDTAQSVFGGASLLLDGTSDSIDTPDHADFVLGSGDWTWDFRIRWNTTGGAGTYPNLLTQIEDTNNFFAVYRDVNNNRIYCQQKEASANIWNFYAPWTPSTATWYHVVISRNGNTPIIAVGGTLLSVTEVTTISGKTAKNLSGIVQISGFNSANFIDGWFDEVRFSNGIARWTANFTPPTAAYAPPVTFVPRVTMF